MSTAPATASAPSEPLTQLTTERWKEAGNVAFKVGDWMNAAEQYELAIAAFVQQPSFEFVLAFPVVACYSNLSVARYKLAQWQAAEKAATQGLALAQRAQASTAAALSSLKVLIEKLTRRSHDAALSSTIVALAVETQTLSRTKPTVFGATNLRAALVDDQVTKYFFAGQFISHAADTSQPLRLLVTLGVFTCITVWAWHRHEQDGKQVMHAFGCHIPLAALLDGVQKYGSAAKLQLLPEMADAMQQCFSTIADKSEVRVSLIGGHQATDHDKALQGYFRNSTTNHQRFSWQIAESVRLAGFTNIDSALLSVFPGSPPDPTTIHNWELSLAKDNQRFFALGLDVHTGAIIAETNWQKHQLLGNSTPLCITQKEAKWLKLLSAHGMGQPLEQCVMCRRQSSSVRQGRLPPATPK